MIHYAHLRVEISRQHCSRCRTIQTFVRSVSVDMVMAKHTPVASRQVARLVGTCSTWAVRWYTYTFLRLVSLETQTVLTTQLPFHDRYMPKIWTFFALYAGSTAYLSLAGTTTSSKIKWARTLISGCYDPSYRLTSLFNILLNLICVMGCLDFVYRAHILHDERDLTFCRTGQVTSDSVKLLCRGAEHNAGNWSICNATGDCSDWTSSSDIAKDQTVVIELSGLSPNSRYTYSSSSGLAGSFVTQRSSSDMQHFTLLSTSCMKPNWPYSPFNHPLRILGIEHITSYLSTSLKKPEMMLFLGDFICK
jgi:alkaline phosphatase D